eukprot:TRINITY_DN3802_c0_g1_i1.p1 TRINITY_DN3802_c0_g1~~TRINITY_DN3802_c0_g1_i1.p1  ORF type:complete len:399 (+),score=68.90 TRINITY_DN3802_c0_g1_i1:202-1398(+)
MDKPNKPDTKPSALRTSGVRPPVPLPRPSSNSSGNSSPHQSSPLAAPGIRASAPAGPAAASKEKNSSPREPAPPVPARAPARQHSPEKNKPKPTAKKLTDGIPQQQPPKNYNQTRFTIKYRLHNSQTRLTYSQKANELSTESDHIKPHISDSITHFSPEEFELICDNHPELHSAIHSDPLRDVLLFPKDDFLIETRTRNQRIKDWQLAEPPTLPHIAEVLTIVTKQYSHIEFKYENFSRFEKAFSLPACRFALSTIHDKIPGLLPATASNTVKQSRSDIPGIDTQITESYTRTQRQSFQKQRNQYRTPLFETFWVSKEPNLQTSRLSKGPETFGEKGIKMLLEVKSLSFQIEPIEPYFISFVIFDVKKKERLSEFFHCDMNDLGQKKSFKRDKGERGC